jgi:hypothetical protein
LRTYRVREVLSPTQADLSRRLAGNRRELDGDTVMATHPPHRTDTTAPSMSRESDGLLARIRHMRRMTTPDVISRLQPAPPLEAEAGQVKRLQERIADLEQLIEGLQDSVHREAERQERRISELEARLVPAALAAALSKDARERGL